MYTNYKKGRKKEYKICKRLELEFDIVQRTAGSRSPIDIIAIDLKLKRIKFVQSKPDSWTENQIKKLMEKHKELNGKFQTEFIVE